MKGGRYRRAVFIVTYSIVNKKPEYLILKRHLHWNGWEFPKGGIEMHELRRLAIRRELYEETGLSPVKIKSFPIKGKYTYTKELLDRRGVTGQTYKLYAAEVEKKRVRIDKVEHLEHKWLPFKQAIKKLTWSNQRKCLRIVDKWLREKLSTYSLM